MPRKINEPFRWSTAPLPIIGLRVVDAEPGLRIEIITAANVGEQVATSVKVPFLPSTMHEDCITIDDHVAEVLKQVDEAAVAMTAELQAALAAEKARTAALEAEKATTQLVIEELRGQIEKHIETHADREVTLTKENEALKSLLAVSRDVVVFAHALNEQLVLFKPPSEGARVVEGQRLRTVLRAYDDGVATACDGSLLYVTEQTHQQAIKQAVGVAAGQFHTVLAECALLLSDAAEGRMTADRLNDVLNKIAAVCEASPATR